MRETLYSTGGFRRITRLGQPVKVRLVGFVLVVVCGGLLLTSMTHSTWDQLDRLQKEHAAVSTESFYLGVTLRGGIRSLNEKLLQFGNVPEPAARAEFLRDATGLRGWLITNRQHLEVLAKLPLLKQVLIDDFDILDKIQRGYDEYLTKAMALLQPARQPLGDYSFHERYNRIRATSSELLRLCDDMVRAQRDDFTDFLAETQTNLMNHERLLKLTSALILALAAALAIMVYRGMIAPLWLGLTQSKTIIERQEKLASLGVLASGVAHEIRNPLTAIKFRLFSLKRALPGLVDNEDTRIIADEINRLERIVKDFLRFARPSEPALAIIALAPILLEVQGLLKGQLERAGIELLVELGTPAFVQADSQQVKQVLINLIQNAAEALGRQGQVKLLVRRDTAELDGCNRPVAIVSVIDNGSGIPPAIEARLFDPFFTTKEGGTGLGLAIAARIVEKHGGMLRYETEEGRGTTFEIVLPQVEQYATETIADRG
jgi:signal transduction histidine kinase